MSALELKTAPVDEPISRSEAKTHLRVDISGDDTLIDNLILAARQFTETYLQRCLITQTWYQYWDWGFPAVLTLEKNPVQSVTAITYVDGNAATQTVDSSLYTVDTNQKACLIYPAYQTIWPVPRVYHNAVKVEFIAGYGDAATDVPEPIRNAMLLLIGHLYENREMTAPINIAEVPFTYKTLLAPYRLVRW